MATPSRLHRRLLPLLPRPHPSLASRLSPSRSRSLHLTTARRLPQPNPTPNSTPFPNLLSRDPLRPLPSLASLSPARRWLTTLPLFLAILTASALGIFNYQKVNSPVITATLYSLRTNPTARAALGDNVYFASQWAWVWGHINLVQGHVDVRFRVKGTKGKGTCRFRARRKGGRAEAFTTEEWSLEMDEGGQKLELLDTAADPLAGQAM